MPISTSDNDEHVLVCPRDAVPEARSATGREVVGRLLASSRFLPRSRAETDEQFRQIIPYVVLRHRRDVFAYRRGSGAELRLTGRLSIGIGGHISLDDIGESTGVIDEDVYWRGLLREVEEEVRLLTAFEDSVLGILSSEASPVDRVHVGVLHLWLLEHPRVEPISPEISKGSFRDLSTIGDHEELEEWSRQALRLVGALP